MTISEKLVILRKKAGMTQDDLAKALDVSRQSVHKWEAGICYPEAMKLVGLKAIFGISIDDLLDDTKEVTLPEKKKAKKAKEEAKTAEESIENTEALTETPAPVLNYAEEVKAEAIEEVAVEVVENEPVKEETAEEEKSKEEERVNEDSEKKKGFFSKLFGRK